MDLSTSCLSHDMSQQLLGICKASMIKLRRQLRQYIEDMNGGQGVLESTQLILVAAAQLHEQYGEINVTEHHSRAAVPPSTHVAAQQATSPTYSEQIQSLFETPEVRPAESSQRAVKLEPSAAINSTEDETLNTGETSPFARSTADSDCAAPSTSHHQQKHVDDEQIDALRAELSGRIEQIGAKLDRLLDGTTAELAPPPPKRNKVFFPEPDWQMAGCLSRTEFDSTITATERSQPRTLAQRLYRAIFRLDADYSVPCCDLRGDQQEKLFWIRSVVGWWFGQQDADRLDRQWWTQCIRAMDSQRRNLRIAQRAHPHWRLVYNRQQCRTVWDKTITPLLAFVDRDQKISDD